ncbi:hypothetical protein Lal_00047288 [Lupinus albus]|uniref:Uncharacterized protein n=1 Tax=Lupinus albus TaxID=3870 RepID=A0A6A4QYT7_LUPAL|nr:hypothetical protein Lalb_Chr02g0143531 [Lupinus albus]KAF1878617.1 hypothetical protein Lal_00047288 [Lupinus albus]
MGIKAVLSRKSRSEHHMLEAMVRKANESGNLRVISCREEGVVRMKIVVKKRELKELVEVISSVKDETHRLTTSSKVEERLNNMLWKKHQSRAKMIKGNHQKCWSPALQCIPEELSL